MKKNQILKSWRIVGGVVLVILLVGQACQKDGIGLMGSSANTLQATHDNQQMIATVQEVGGVTASAFTQQGISSGRVASEGDDGDDESGCRPSITSNIKLDRTHPDSVIYSGVITIDYGGGATCMDSLETRKGVVTDSFMLVIRIKDSVSYSLWEKIKFVNYVRDSTTLDGSISITSSSSAPTVIHVDETKVRYHDGTSTTWNGDLVFTIHNSGHHWGGTMDVTGSWSGVTRTGASFTANITKAIEFSSSCFGFRRAIPVSGTVDITTGGVLSTIDYGNGACDRIYTITTGGVTTQHKFRKGEC